MGAGVVVTGSPGRWGMSCFGHISMNTYVFGESPWTRNERSSATADRHKISGTVRLSTTASEGQPQVTGGAMQHATSWHIEVLLYEDGDRTRAEAVLRTSAGTELRSEGIASRNPKDTDVPEIGEELATSRALSGLAHALFEATVADIEQNVHRPVRLES